MHHRIDFEPKRRCFIVTTEGQGSAEGIIASMEATASHPQWRPGDSVIVDHRKLDLADIPNAGIEKVSHRFIELGKVFGDGRCAVVLARDIDFGLSRAWEMLTEDEVDAAIHIFRSMDKARAWIDAGRRQRPQA